MVTERGGWGLNNILPFRPHKGPDELRQKTIYVKVKKTTIWYICIPGRCTEALIRFCNQLRRLVKRKQYRIPFTDWLPFPYGGCFCSNNIQSLALFIL
jgi:hypothetical protein